MRHTTRSAAETEAVGAKVAERVRPGDVVLVSGELGTGKTTLVRGASRQLGVREPITSPTFVIGRRYEGRVPVSHLDLFRLASLADEEPDLLAEYLSEDAVCFIEWPAVAQPELERVTLRIELRHGGGDVREITLTEAEGE